MIYLRQGGGGSGRGGGLALITQPDNLDASKLHNTDIQKQARSSSIEDAFKQQFNSPHENDVVCQQRDVKPDNTDTP